MDRRSFFKNVAVSGAAALGAAGLGSPAMRRLSGGSRGARGASSAGRPMRPPGALPEGEFLARCIRCQRCADACPNHAIVPMGPDEGRARELTPVIRPRRQACMLCNKVEGDTLKCTDACPSGALETIRNDPEEIFRKVDMGVAEIDLALCYSYNDWSCGACYRACPFPGVAMKLGMWERPEVVPDACIGCGLCERSCIRYPHAIRVRPGRAT